MALVAAFLSPIFINAAVTDRGLHNILWFLLFSGLPTFLIWAHYVLKIEKYKASTGISYPSTYIVLAIASALLMVGPLVLFFSLLIRLSNVPRLETSRDSPDNPTIRKPSPDPPSASLSQQAPTPPAVPKTPPNGGEVIIQSRNIAPQRLSPKAIMKPEQEQRSSALPFIDDEPFYEEVAKEFETDSMKPGLWTKALAEADGEQERVKPIYIRLRVAQLLAAKEAEFIELQRLEDERIKAEEEAARMEAAEAARQEAVEFERQKEEADAEEARKVAERQAAMIAEQERDVSDARQRLKALERFRNESANLASFSVALRTKQGHSYGEYNLQIGFNELLFTSWKGESFDILVSPILGDRIKLLPWIRNFYCLEIELVGGTLLEGLLGEISHKALSDWVAR
jgi:hypothetical protein